MKNADGFGTPSVPWGLVAATGAALLLAACGGGNDNGGGDGSGTPAPGSIDLAQRVSAASATAQSATNACAPIQPFFWEVGDQTGRLASGSVQSSGGAATYTGSTLMGIASASKWLYGAYVVQRRQGQLSDEDVKFLTFRSGYTYFSRCLPGQTVDECVAYQNNDVYSPATDGRFSYGGGHMEKHAALNGLGPLDSAGLAVEMQSQLGTDVVMGYSQPQLAGGVVTNADAYGVFLRKILSGQLLMRGALGQDAVCTNPTTCPPGTAVHTPIPESESYHYAIGHWVEDDPNNGDGAFSSAGAFGFYPWIDAGKTWYGIIARKDTSAISDPDDPDSAGHGYASARCGQLIRKAWISGVPG